MCFPSVDAPEPIEIEKPVFVRNPFLDEDEQNARSADALRRGRSSLVIPGGTGIGFEGAGGQSAAVAGGSGSRAGYGPKTIGGSGAGGSNSLYDTPPPTPRGGSGPIAHQ